MCSQLTFLLEFSITPLLGAWEPFEFTLGRMLEVNVSFEVGEVFAGVIAVRTTIIFLVLVGFSIAGQIART
jgi:hypothetical protein